jgi:hypothetical protein
MSLCQVIMSIITGVISGFITTGMCYWLGRKKRFKSEQQSYARYIFRIESAIDVAYSRRDSSVLLMMLAEQPVLNDIHKRALKRTLKRFKKRALKRFKNYDMDKIDKILFDLRKCFDDIENAVKNNTLYETSKVKYIGKLHKLAIDLLKVKY